MQSGAASTDADGTVGAVRPPRITGIDLFRGGLLVFVVLGHFAELTQRHHFLTWFGYGFRMPLFIGLTGFMFNLDHARSVSVGELLRKYHDRLILPWIVACAVTLAITGSFEWRSPVYAIVRPPFHLWFVPVMMAFILVATVSRLSRTQMLAVALPLSIGAMYVFGVGHDIWQIGPWMPDRRYFIYPVYFTLGMWAARRDTASDPVAPLIAVALVGAVWWGMLHEQASTAGEAGAELLMCVPLIILFPRLRHVRFDIPLVSAVGRDSLFFYLWHPLAFAVWRLAGASGPMLLALSVGSILLAWVATGRTVRLAHILGVRPARQAGPSIATSQRDAVSTEGAA